MDASKKLVRGLKDISPLFQEEPPHSKISRPLELQVLGISSPHYDEDSFFLNAFLASQFTSSEKPISLVSVFSRYSQPPQDLEAENLASSRSHFHRHCIYWDQLEDVITLAPESHDPKRLVSRDIFLDFERHHLLYSPRVIRLLDKWVLVMRPTAESLTEGYKMMKAGFAMNPEVEFFIILEGKAQEAQGRVIYEHFSNFIMRHLQVNLGWLGWVDFSDPAHQFSSALHIDQLFYQSWQVRPCLEKFVLASWVESMEEKTKTAISAEAFK